MHCEYQRKQLSQYLKHRLLSHDNVMTLYSLKSMATPHVLWSNSLSFLIGGWPWVPYPEPFVKPLENFEMKKTLVAVAALVATGAFAEVKISGAFESGIQAASTTTSGAKRSTVAFGDAAGNSALTFSGSEDIGGGMKAMFQIQTTVQAADQGAGLAGYQSFVGVDGGFGEVKLGSFASPSALVVFGYDGSNGWGGNQLAARLPTPVQYNTVENQEKTTSLNVPYGATNFFPSNQLQYTLPKMIDGLSVVFNQRFGEAASAKTGSTTIGNITTYALGYKVAGLSLDYVNATHKASATVDDAHNAIGASYDFGVAALKLANVSSKAGTAAAKTATGYAVSVPFGAAKITVGQSSDNNTVKASTTEVLIQYSLSKRTSVYLLNSSTTGVANVAADKASFNRLSINHSF
jgi:predicted porin